MQKITVCKELEFPIPVVVVFPLSTVAMNTTVWLLTSPEMPPLHFLRNLTLPWQKNMIYFSLYIHFLSRSVDGLCSLSLGSADRQDCFTTFVCCVLG